MDFTAASADEGFRFAVHVQGQWRRRGRRHYAPAAAAASHVIDDITKLAAGFSILSPTALQERANARLGRPARLPSEGVSVTWALVQIHVTPEDLEAAQSRIRVRAQARADAELKQLRITQAAAYRDQLREDPTLALAQLLLESPEAVTEQTVTIIPKIAEQVAAYAPGAAWVQTAHLLAEWYGTMPPDAKQFVIDRLCTVASEFAGEEVAQRLKGVYGSPTGDEPWPAGNAHGRSEGAAYGRART
ncbi:hypothetical protein [Streptomyces seoulensis]|uniref:hypothetical protein n=1 Tax=Streptomyces seoulensis TaxID=73044 RepID=UPI00103EF4A4|nr:hypothetical protein [Streptomyces seoulensis]